MIYYTVNIGNYIEDLQAPSWVQVITEVEESTGDMVRDSRIPKIRCPFSGPSVYIDASRVHLLSEKFKDLSEEIFEKHDLFVLHHPHEHTYLEECAEYVHRGWVSEEDILSFTEHIKETYNFETHFQSMGTIIWRRDQDEFNERWWELYMLGGVRDQLSMAVSLPTEYGSTSCRDFINKFSNAEPNGEWWQIKSGAYKYYESKNPIDFVKKLSRITGLSYSNYRTLECPVEYSDHVDISFGKVSGYIPFGRTSEGKNYDLIYVSSSVKMEKMIVYTCITNGYDEIPDHYYDPDVQYVCFTDGTVEKKGPWEFRDILIEHDCPRRRSAHPKINPHLYFPIGSKTTWLDGCYVMTKEYVERSKQNLDNYNFTIMRHPNKFSYLDEVLEGFMASMNTWDDQILITQTIKDVGYNFYDYISPVLGSMWRVVTEDLVKFDELWWKYSLVGPNRDQISFDTARQLTSMDMNILEDGWIRKETNYAKELGIKTGWQNPGTMGILFGYEGKKGRKKLHPQAGHDKQYLERDKLLAELKKITGLHPYFYAKYDHMPFVHRNVIEPYLPES